MKREKDALLCLCEAESIIGSPLTSMFVDNLTGNPRQRWLNRVREVLRANGVEPENLPGRWHTSRRINAINSPD